MNESKLSQLQYALTDALLSSIQANPLHYSYGAESVPKVVTRIMDSLRESVYSVHIHGEAMKAALKSLGVKPSYKALSEWLKN